MTEQELMYASPEDQEFYLNAVKGLPGVEGFTGTGFDEDGIRIPYGCGPHSVRCLREIVSIVKPTKILEIGFNCGFSASMWLNLTEKARLFSCDISKKRETIAAADILEERFPMRFFYFDRNEDTSITEVNGFDLIFIDGGHLYENVKEDIELALNLKIPYLAFDDILEEFGPGVMPAIREYPQLELVKEMGNIALYKNKTV